MVYWLAGFLTLMGVLPGGSRPSPTCVCETHTMINIARTDRRVFLTDIIDVGATKDAA
jgi:hypothetical protein